MIIYVDNIYIYIKHYINIKELHIINSTLNAHITSHYASRIQYNFY